MLKTYQLLNGGLRAAPLGDGIGPQDIWIDLFDPTAEERHLVTAALGLDMPTHEDMQEIEVSSRLYSEEGGLFMTALLLTNTDSDRPDADVVTFILTHERLVTLRYIDPQPFRTFAARCERGVVAAAKAEIVLTSLLDVIIDRMADVLERVGSDIETVSRGIFAADAAKSSSKDFQDVLRTLGRKHDLSGKMRESLLTLARMLSFLVQAMEGKPNKDVRGHLKTLTRDIQSLQDHSSYLASKLSYLLDATLGLINIDQNNIIKIMSVAAMVFLPPTLIASVEGMNFKFMPELDWSFGYPISILLMIVSAIVPYFWFKRRGWL